MLAAAQTMRAPFGRPELSRGALEAVAFALEAGLHRGYVADSRARAKISRSSA